MINLQSELVQVQHFFVEENIYHDDIDDDNDIDYDNDNDILFYKTFSCQYTSNILVNMG